MSQSQQSVAATLAGIGYVDDREDHIICGTYQDTHDGIRTAIEDRPIAAYLLEGIYAILGAGGLLRANQDGQYQNDFRTQIFR
jgi:hypothetical protein